MAGIYSVTYTNNLGNTVDLTIQRGSAALRELKLADSPLKITYAVEDEDDIFSPVVTSRCELRVFIGIDEDSIEFFEDMSTAKDGEWHLDVVVFDGANQVGEWSGFIVPDGLSRGISYRNDIITVKAVDVLERAKSFTLKKTDGTQFVGRYKLRDYIDAIVIEAWGGIYEYEENTNIVLSNNTASPVIWPPATEQLWTDASAFNDNNGRAINSFDCLKMIAKALGSRFYYENGKVVLREILSLDALEFGLPISLIGIKSGSVDDNFLIGNREVLTRVPTYKEVKGAFDYEGADGIVQNGAMQFYDVDGKPSNVDANAPLLALPDMNVRKRGNGREQNQYGFMIRSTYVEPDGTDLSRRIDTWDMLAFRTPLGIGIPRSTEITIAVTARLEDVGTIWEIDDQTYTAMIVDAIIYNDSNPSQSVRSILNDEGVPTWQSIDLSGNSTFSSGHYDFNVNARNRAWFAVVPPTLETFGAPANFISQYGTPIKFSGAKDVSQSGSVDLSPSPVGGTLYVAISQIFDIGPMQTTPDIPELNASSEMNTRIEGVLVSAKGLKDGKTETVYQTRFGDQTTDKKEFEIELGTSANPTTKGALWTDITYQDADSKVGRFYRGPGWVRGIQHEDFSLSLPSPWNGYLSLLMYNSMARMAYNRVQNKMDFSCVAKSLRIGNVIAFPDLVDASRASTELYGEVHIQQMQVWDLTTGERDITAISLVKDIRGITAEGEPDETTDLVERYYQ